MDDVFGLWFIVGALLVFFMQAGFAMVEAGFTWAKNASNIVMKNTLDFSSGAVVFLFLGYGLLSGPTATPSSARPTSVGSARRDLPSSTGATSSSNSCSAPRPRPSCRGRGRAHQVRLLSGPDHRDLRAHLPHRDPLGLGRRLAL